MVKTESREGSRPEATSVRESGDALMRAPRGSRLGIGLFGRRNVGKSSVLNAITNQQASIVSDYAGTTTDPVDKPMELLPLGPVLFVDTAGIDDEGEVGRLRIERTEQVYSRCDMGVLVTEAGVWGAYEDRILAKLQDEGIPVILVFNKTDLLPLHAAGGADGLMELCREGIPAAARGLPAVCMAASERKGVAELRQALLDNAPDGFVNAPAILSDIVPAGSVVVLVIPIDKEAPRGRLILPQVQTIRDLLDGGCIPLCVRDTELPAALAALEEPPRLGGDRFPSLRQRCGHGARQHPVDRVLRCVCPQQGRPAHPGHGHARHRRAHGGVPRPDRRGLHAPPHRGGHRDGEDPPSAAQEGGGGPDHRQREGADFPANLGDYDLVIHCGGCMFTRRQVLSRVRACVEAGVPVSNYGLTIAYCTGVFERSIRAFPWVAEQVMEGSARSA